MTGLRAMRGRRRDGGVTVVQLAIAMAVLVVAVMAFVNSRTNCLNDTTVSSASNPLSGC